MAVRRKTNNRWTLFRQCGTCGKSFQTTADTPWVRQVPRDGKKQATTYYCSSKCFKASYKHIGWYDGLAYQRRLERGRNVPKERKAELWKAYYSNPKNAEKVKKRRMERYYENRESELEDNRFYREKRKLLMEVSE